MDLGQSSVGDGESLERINLLRPDVRQATLRIDREVAQGDDEALRDPAGYELEGSRSGPELGLCRTNCRKHPTEYEGTPSAFKVVRANAFGVAVEMKGKAKRGRARKEPEPTGVCWCGCGGKTARFFMPGHDRRAVEAVLHGVYGSVAGFLLAHGRAPGRRRRRRAPG
jgi:hypothetical protein